MLDRFELEIIILQQLNVLPSFNNGRMRNPLFQQKSRGLQLLYSSIFLQYLLFNTFHSYYVSDD